MMKLQRHGRRGTDWKNATFHKFSKAIRKVSHRIKKHGHLDTCRSDEFHLIAKLR